MFAFDTTFPINILFLLFLLLFLSACTVGMSEAPEGDDGEDDLPAAFRAMTKLTDIPPVQMGIPRRVRGTRGSDDRDVV